MEFTLTRKKDGKAKGKKGDPQSEVPEEAQVAKPPSKFMIILATQFPSVFKNIDHGAVAEVTKSKLPIVNMLPPLMVLSVQRRAVVRQLMGMAGFVAVVIAALWFIQGTSIQVATLSLEDTQKQVQQSLDRVDELKGVSQYFDNLQVRMNIGAAAFMEQADYPVIVEDLLRAAPEGVVIQSITMDYVPLSNEDAPSCGENTSPFATESARVLGCIQFAGTAESRDLLAEFIRSLDNTQYLQLPFVTPSGSSNKEGAAAGNVTFSGQAGIRQEANLGATAVGLIDTTGVEGIEPADPNALLGGDTSGETAPATTESAAPANGTE